MKLIIPSEIEKKIHAYVMSVDSEIAGMGKVRVEGDSIVVEDVMIYDQTVTAGTADLSPQAIARWQSELVRAGGSPKHWRLWWHSHDVMDAFFSKRDTDTMDVQTEADWMLSLVVNKKRERKARLDMYRPFRLFIDNVDIEVEGEQFTVPADIALEVADKVKRPKAIVSPYAAPKKSKAGYHTEEEDERMYPAETAEVIATIKEIDLRLKAEEKKGVGDGVEARELMSEMADWYYYLAGLETNPDIAETILAEARSIEDRLYSLDPIA